MALTFPWTLKHVLKNGEHKIFSGMKGREEKEEKGKMKERGA